MELETVNKLYLELSQFATAKTAREIKLEKLLEEAARYTRHPDYDWDEDFKNEVKEALQ